ncbi:MAG: ankyrin repeat domain-containing protein, partial [Gemmatimonadales bacterium]
MNSLLQRRLPITAVGAATMILLLCGSNLGAVQNNVSSVADAVMEGDTSALDALLDEGANINSPQVDGSTALHWAVYRNDIDTAQLLIEAGADPSAVTRAGISPLYMASLYGNPQMIRILFTAGADVNEVGPYEVTPLMLAARNGNPEAIEVLLEAGAETEAVESIRGTTALMWAVDQKHPEAVRVLLEAGADFSARSGEAGLPRNYVSNRVSVDTVREARERLRLAKETGVSPEELRRAEEAREVGTDLETVATFLVARASAEERDPEEILEDVNDQVPNLGVNALFLAGRVRELAGEEDSSALDSVSDDQEDDAGPVAGLVGSGGGGLTPLVFAARVGDESSARLLVEAGADVNQVTEYGWSPLLTATNNRHYQLGRYLIEQGADVNAANDGGMTPLYLATD